MENNDNKIEQVLEENLRLTKEIHEMTKSVKRYVTFQKVLSFVYLLLIIVPLILGAIYLPALFKNTIGQYQELLGTDFGKSFQDVLNNATNPGAGDIKNQLMNKGNK